MASEKKMYSTRLDSKTIQDLADQSAAVGMTMADFVSSAIVEKCERERREQADTVEIQFKLLECLELTRFVEENLLDHIKNGDVDCLERAEYIFGALHALKGGVDFGE